MVYEVIKDVQFQNLCDNESILFLRKLKNDKRKGKKKSKLKSKEKKNKVRSFNRLLLYNFLGLFIYILHCRFSIF